MSDIVRIAEHDNVAVALRPLPAGAVVGGLRLTADVPAGHKLALVAIAAGEPVIKYGYPIGVAARAIAAGEHVHSHNLDGALPATFAASRTGGMAPRPQARPETGAAPVPTFDGYRRADGRVGIRNEIWIVNTVGCVSHAAERIAEGARALLAGEPGIDGIHALTQPFGCSQLGQDLEATRRIVAALVRHPNAAGVLVLGLGCENNQLSALLAELGPMPP